MGLINFVIILTFSILEKVLDKISRILGRSPRLRIGSIAPDFHARSTCPIFEAKTWNKGQEFHFYEYIENSWAVLFSHPCDFTPVCTTEIAGFVDKTLEFEKRGVKLIGLSMGPVETHYRWIKDIHKMLPGRTIKFPIIGDKLGKVAHLYDMIDKAEQDDLIVKAGRECEKHTVRSVFIIDDEKKPRIRAILSYPVSTGRSINEILRMIDSLQMSTEYLTPCEWRKDRDAGAVLVRETDLEILSVQYREAERRYPDIPYLNYMPLAKVKQPTLKLET